MLMVILVKCEKTDQQHHHHHQVSLTKTAICKAHCVASLMASAMSDTDCIHSTECATCWLTCEYLVNRPHDHAFICGPDYRIVCLRGCHTACDVIKRHTRQDVISADYNKWSFTTMAEVEMIGLNTLYFSWTRPVKHQNNEVSGQDSDTDQTIIYVIIQRSSRDASWLHLHSTTELQVAVNVVEGAQGDVYYRILAVTRDGLLADMDVTFSQRDLQSQHVFMKFTAEVTTGQQQEHDAFETSESPTLKATTEQVTYLFHDGVSGTEDSPEILRRVVDQRQGLSSLHYYLLLTGCLLPPSVLCFVTVIIYRKKNRQLNRLLCGKGKLNNAFYQENNSFSERDIFNPRDPLLKKHILSQMSRPVRTDMNVQTAYHHYISSLIKTGIVNKKQLKYIDDYNPSSTDVLNC